MHRSTASNSHVVPSLSQTLPSPKAIAEGGPKIGSPAPTLRTSVSFSPAPVGGRAVSFSPVTSPMTAIVARASGSPAPQRSQISNVSASSRQGSVTRGPSKLRRNSLEAERAGGHVREFDSASSFCGSI